MNVKELRETYGLSIDEMSELLGCNRTTLSRLQTDAAGVTKVFARVLHAMQVVIDKGWSPKHVGMRVKRDLRTAGGLQALHTLLEHVFAEPQSAPSLNDSFCIEDGGDRQLVALANGHQMLLCDTCGELSGA